MPKLYEYLGITIFFYSNEHEPVHVHGRYQGKENKAEIITEDGKIVHIHIGTVLGKPPLPTNQLNEFEKFVKVYAEEIIQKWIDYFVYNRRISPKRITRRV